MGVRHLPTRAPRGTGAEPTRTRFHGTIAGVGFASGDRFVLGIWETSPFGAFADVMWSQAKGTRVLLADGAPRAFLTRHYRFDEALAVAVEARWVDGRLVVRAGDLCLELEPGRRTALGALVRLRPRGLTGRPGWMAAEDRVLRPLVRPLLGGGRGVRLCGTTAAGVTERYGIEDMRLLAGARGEAGGRDLGPMTAVPRPAGFGFSEFPVRPGVATVTSLFDEPPEV